MNKETIIITGATGQLGQFVVKYLQDNNIDINIVATLRHKSFDNQTYIFDSSRVTWELMDLSDPISIENLIVKYKPKYFLNTAANAFVGESWSVPVQHIEINTLGVLYQLEAIRKHSPLTRYLNLGTSEEFGADVNNGNLQNESTLIDPKSPYACSKAAARYLVNIYRNSYNLYAVQPWCFNFESELRGEKYVTRKITKGVARIFHAIQNKESYKPIELGNLNSYRSWQFTGDVADAIWRMLNQDVFNPNYTSPKSYVISADSCHTVRDFINKALDAAGINDSCMFDSAITINQKFVRPHDVTYLNGDASAIIKDLGWARQYSFYELVQRMVEYDIKNYKKELTF